jgi:hypothetical protein
MSDVFTKRAAQQKLGTIVRGKKDLWDGTPGHLFAFWGRFLKNDGTTASQR